MPEESIADAVAISASSKASTISAGLHPRAGQQQQRADRRPAPGRMHPFPQEADHAQDLRVLTCASRLFRAASGYGRRTPKTAPKPQAPSAKGSPRVSPDIPNLPELPEPAKPLAPALSAPRDSHAAEPAPVERHLRLPVRSKAGQASRTRSAHRGRSG